MALSARLCFAEQAFVELSAVPEDGFVVCPLDVTPAANWLAAARLDGAAFFYGERKLDAAFVPGESPFQGTFVAELPGDVPRGGPVRLRIEARDAAPPPRRASPITVGALTFDAATHGGLPSRFTFPGGVRLESVKWLDRLHDPKTGSWGVTNERLEQIVDQPFLKVVRTVAAFKRGDDAPPSRPRAEYQWFVFPQRALVYATVLAQQDEPSEWREKHFFELHHPVGTNWFGDGASGAFTGTQKSQTFSRYAGFRDEAGAAVAVISRGILLHDGLNAFGPYLMPRGNEAWQAWADTKHRMAAWYWVGNSEDPAKALQSAYEAVTKMPRTEIVIPKLQDTAKDWKAVALNDLFLSGKIATLSELERLRKARRLPENWIALNRAGLVALFEKTGDEGKGKGLRLLSLIDTRANTVLSARAPVPLFTAELLNTKTGKTVTINSGEGWRAVEWDAKKETFTLRGATLPDGDGETLCVVLRTKAAQPKGRGADDPGIHWSWVVLHDGCYEFRSATCGQIALRNLGPAMKAFYPHASGVVTENPCAKELRWQGTYPSGWCSMQYMAVYDEAKKIGLYVAAHDAGGAVNKIRIDADAVSDALTLRFEQPLPLDGKVEHGGAVWRAMSGDWFDAALIYRQWVRAHADWYPRQRLGPGGRTDTPQWMKELSVWALCSDAPQKMPETMRRFTDALGIPTAVHWYNWHQIPFDNDYPHYFPVKDGFKEAVAEIQKNGDCFVMPYINGRLWDTRDKGAEDFQFTSLALPGATKKEDGKPYIETYGSKESDGSNVELAVMCPASAVWRDKVTENISRLVNEYGVAAVYVDQVAAAQPELCFDKMHGHPLAGGDWWNREHWTLYAKIRGELPKDRMLTTECNAEPFVNIFDGYLTWHFQYQDQVPAFAAVYGGAVQMFGRAYRGGPSQILADRMKAAEQLVYGEQIGWLDPRVIDDPKRFPFFKAIVQMRHRHRDYFCKGEMIRPPKLLDAIPAVTADWQWSGEWNVTAAAVQTGAWRKTDKNGKTVSAVLFFVNVSDTPVSSRTRIDLAEIGLGKGKLAIRQITSEGIETPIDPSVLNHPQGIVFPGGSISAWEITTR
ncbi:MAG: DUF6259 domain-containing protein [Kiritimatiellaeota bacterium]|nr:DUF6259 domain-containing protein [Kiritimatiellota bacterium]